MLEVNNIDVAYETRDRFNRKFKIKVLEDFSMTLDEGESLAIVGESGSGKSTLAKAICGINPLDGGEIVYRGSRLKSLGDKNQDFQVRKDIQMVFQNSYSSLNPKLKVKKLIGEILLHHKISTKESLLKDTIDILESVSLDKSYLDRYPGQLSGGQRQRINLARGLAGRPEILVLDEPTSALDLVVQKDILELLKKLRKDFNLTYIFISHDLEVVRYICDRVIIMKDGRIVEEGLVEEIFTKPREDYSRKLLASIPKGHPLD